MENFAKLIRQHENFLLTTHVMPDGDGLGSEMALHLYLKKMGKKSTVINTHPTPPKFRLVDPRGEIKVFQPGMKLPPTDVVFVLDTNELKMLGPLEPPIRASGAPIVFVDHHVPEVDNVQDHLIDEAYGSTGELVYSFLRHLRADIDIEIALGIYVAIVTDTASFRFKRTTARSHTIAAELLQKGVLPEQVYQHIYSRDSFAKIRLFGHVLQGMQTTPDERIAWLTVTKETREHYHATIEDTESYVNQLTHIEGVDIGVLFREEDDGRIKISIRGNGEIPVIGIAKKFGGGGHRHAAGAKITESLEESTRRVLQEAQTLLTGYPPKKR